MASFKTPSSPPRSAMIFSTFLGADFTNSPANVDVSKSPNCQNMIRDVPGKVRKRMGYEVVERFGGRVNGFHYIYGHENGIYHIGTDLYKDGEVVYSGIADVKSKSWQFDDKLYIIDGKALLVYDGEKVQRATETAKIPTISISKDPSGGGTSYDALNLLQPGFTELFLGTEEVTEYQLTFGGLDETKVQASVLNSDGEWVEKTEETDFTVDRENGIVTFVNAPGKSPVTGEDNVKITAFRTVDGYADRINKCSIGTLYGVSGANDRLFLSGNPDFINYDWYSDQYDPSYFPDTAYSVLGTGRSAIMGYSVIGNLLATHKDEMDIDQSIILREGVLSNGDPAFRTVNSLQGAGSISKNAFAYLVNEPLFLTRSGVYAVTTQDLTGEKYLQCRSFFVNGKLLKEVDLEKAHCVVHNDMYWLCVNGVVYILDGIQPMTTDPQMPYSTRQYAGFYQTNIPASVMWTVNNVLYFGTEDGRVCRFFTDTEALESYSDDGEPIDAIWETPDLDGSVFYKKKTFRHIAVRMQYALATSFDLYGMKHGIWSLIKHFGMGGRGFGFDNLDFANFSFETDTTQRMVTTKIRIKKVDKARFRLQNNVKNESFGLYDIGFEFVENGNYKG